MNVILFCFIYFVLFVWFLVENLSRVAIFQLSVSQLNNYFFCVTIIRCHLQNATKYMYMNLKCCPLTCCQSFRVVLKFPVPRVSPVCVTFLRSQNSNIDISVHCSQLSLLKFYFAQQSLSRYAIAN